MQEIKFKHPNYTCKSHFLRLRVKVLVGTPTINLSGNSGKVKTWRKC